MAVKLQELVLALPGPISNFRTFHHIPPYAAVQRVHLQAGTKLKIDQEGGGGSGAAGKAESLVAFAKRVNRGRALSKSGGPGGKGGKGAGMMAELGLKLAGGGDGGSPVQSQLALKLAKRRADAEAKADKS